MAERDQADRSDVLQSLGLLAQKAAPTAVLGIFLLAVFYTLYFAAGLFLPILLALFLSIILRPIVRWLSRLGAPDQLGAIVVVLALFGVITGGFAMLITPATEWINRLPQIQSELQFKLWPVAESIKDAKKASKTIEDLAKGDKTEQQAPLVQKASLAERAFNFTWATIAQGLITLALLFFFLAEGRKGIDGLINLLPWMQQRAYVHRILEGVNERIASYLQTICLINLGLACLTAAGLFWLDMPDPILWGVFAGCMGFLPYLGPLMVILALAIAAILTFDSWWSMAIPVLFYTILTTIEGYLVTPSIIGRRLTLNPISVFLSMLIWTWVWGIPGALLSVPILVCARLIVGEILKSMDHERVENAPATNGSQVLAE